MTPDMEMVTICQEMGWTYYDFINQPAWFIELVEAKLRLDNERIRKEANRHKRK
jgi:hypothetical protein